VFGYRVDAPIRRLDGFSNVIWNGRDVVCENGDGTLFTDFSDRVDIIAHALTHSVVQSTANLDCSGESGALHEHFCDVFALLAKQHATGGRVSWLIGEGL